MAWSYHLDPHQNALFVNVSGVFTEDEFWSGIRRGTADPHFRPDLRVLIDLSRVEHFGVSGDALFQHARARHLAANAKRAFVVSSGLIEAFADFYRTSGAPEQIRVFFSREEALAWLGVSFVATA